MADQTRSFIHSSLALQPFVGLWTLLQFHNLFYTGTGLLGRVISQSHGRYLHTRQHKHRINAHTNIHALSRIRTHDPYVLARNDSSCLRPRGHCDQHQLDTNRTINWIYVKMYCGTKRYKWGSNLGFSYRAPSLNSLSVLEINWNMLREKNVKELQNSGEETSWEADIWKTIGG
jgi:hypothetical protein